MNSLEIRSLIFFTRTQFNLQLNPIVFWYPTCTILVNVNSHEYQARVWYALQSSQCKVLLDLEFSVKRPDAYLNTTLYWWANSRKGGSGTEAWLTFLAIKLIAIFAREYGSAR